MSNLWDLVHRSPLPSFLDTTLQGTEAFDVTDAMRLHAESYEDESDWGEFPNIAPPFRQYFMFGKMPKIYRVGGVARAQDVEGGELGALFLSSKIADGWNVAAICVGSCKATGRARWEELSLIWQLDVNGRLRTSAGGNRFALAGKPEYLDRLQSEAAKHGEDIVGVFATIFYPYALATAMLHCKNVTAKRVCVPHKLAEAARRRGRPRYTYSVLDITPMRKVLRVEGGLGESGSSLSRALHICRGHFKDYRDGSGLFGKHKAVYWWESAVRGSVESGVRVKDYRLSVGNV